MASAAANRVSRCYALGNNDAAEDTMLKSKLLAAVFEAVGEGALSASEGEECMACLFEFQANTLAAVAPLLHVLDVLAFSAARVWESGGAQSRDRPTMLIRDVQARFRDAVAHGLFAHNLGFDSKKQFISLVWHLHGCSSDADLSSKMQNAYTKIMKAYQDWFRILDLESGLVDGEADSSSGSGAESQPRSSTRTARKVGSDSSLSSSLREEQSLEPMKVTISTWLEGAL